MFNKTRTFLFIFATIALLTVSAVGTTTVYADDETPTPTPEASTDGSGGDESGATEGVTTEEQPPAESTEAASESTPILAQLPDNTTLTVVDSEGNPAPLASQESANAIATSDPIWCPDGAPPVPGENGCTQSYTSFTDLLTFLEQNETDPLYQQSGTIFVQQGEYLGGESAIDFNDYEFNSFNQYDLTIQGGWDTTDNTLDPADTSTLTAPLIIGSLTNPWVGSLTLININIDGVTDSTALTLVSSDSITLSNVDVTNSQNGADLNAGTDVVIEDSAFTGNTQAGATVTAGGNVEVSNSDFSNNGTGVLWNAQGSGLNVNSGGAVTLRNVEANNNQLYGANVVAVGNVLVVDSFFNGNISYAFLPTWQDLGFGLQVSTTGNIALDGVTANQNLLFGANLTGVNVEVLNSQFNDNGSTQDEDAIGDGHGLNVQSSGAVTLRDIEANNNGLYGTNVVATGDVLVTDSFFNGNGVYHYEAGTRVYDGTGLQIVTLANIIMNRVTAEDNFVGGAHLEGAEISIANGIFNNNGANSLWSLDLVGYGIEIISTSAVSIFNIQADGNELFGANIQAADNVSIGGVNSFSGNRVYTYDYFSNQVNGVGGGYGLMIVAGGDISLDGVTANNNYLGGATLDGASVTVSNSFFSSNGSGLPPGLTSQVTVTGSGLTIKSLGNVSLLSIEANQNQLYGADVQAGGQVVISRAFFTGNQTVTLNPLVFYGYGLTVNTPGEIILNYVEANFNHLWGASLTGSNTSIGNSVFNNNISDSTQFIDDTGLLINSTGTVSLFNVEARENRLIGANIVAAGDVFITNSVFSDNQGITCTLVWCPAGSIIYHGYGLSVTTPGSIFLDGVTASNNNLFGAQLNGAFVTVENSFFNDNQLGNGLIINATDGVTLNAVTASGNTGNGVDVTASNACTIVQVNDGTFENNTQYGLSVTGGTLVLGGTQVFTNNLAGNIFHATTLCELVTPPPPLTTNTEVVVPLIPVSGTVVITDGPGSDTTSPVLDKAKPKAKKPVKPGRKSAKVHRYENHHRFLRR